jgi:hypothetical protein
MFLLFSKKQQLYINFFKQFRFNNLKLKFFFKKKVLVAPPGYKEGGLTILLAKASTPEQVAQPC